MKNLIAIVVSLVFAGTVFAQKIPFRYEELTAPDFVKAVEKSAKTCIIPIGVMEKHGTHLPLSV